MSPLDQPERRSDGEVVALEAQAQPHAGAEQADRASNDRLTRMGDRLVLGIARHWLALFNLAVFVYVAVPFLAPVLMKVGATGAARIVYTVYSPACHQLPDRSYFLFGEQPVYSLQELEDANVLPSTFILDRRKYIGDDTLGYKVALCERDVAIYGAVLLGGLLFGLLRERVPKLPFKVYLLFLVPVALDGFSQLFGFRSSNWWLRTITGALFGLATVWLAYPYIQESMADIRRDIERKLAGTAGDA
ncbi:MAG: DUF2085 domain-containing protein [Anaerolineae bacterium]